MKNPSRLMVAAYAATVISSGYACCQEPSLAEVEIGEVRPLVPAAPPFPLVETYLAVSPRDSDHLLASAMSMDTRRSIVFRSVNGGASWAVTEGPQDGVFPGGDPMLAFDDNGRAYFSTITPEINVWRSDDVGRTWTGPVIVGRGRSSDRQWIAPLPVQDGQPAWVIATSKVPAEGARHDLLFALSRDGGVTFAEPTIVPQDSGFLHAVTHVTARSDGTAFLTYLVNYAHVPGPEETVRGTRWIIVSKDRGRSWSAPRRVTPNRVFGNRTGERAMKGLSAGGLAVDESGGPNDGSAYQTWLSIIDGHLQVLLARSNDEGATWSEPVRVNDGGFDIDHSTPSIAVNRDGVMAVTWNDRRADPAGLCFQHFVAVSTDGGQTFGVNRPVSDKQTCLPARSRWLNGGDTQGLIALPDGSFRTVWVVGRDGDLKPWTAVIRPQGSAGRRSSLRTGPPTP